jgi:hypothetical protein
MNAEQLEKLSQVYADNREFINNEETAKMALVVPFIRLLGYDPNVPREVRPEYTADFTQGDGKRLPDRMDFAIFDRTGAKPLMIIETKPVGTNLRSKSQQLARYISQLPDLHFGILTDGCVYQFYGDLDSPNVMDSEPFFTFSLDDPKTDWTKIALFLSKFSRDAFNAETLLTDAEDSRYRQAMVDKLVRVLRAPVEDEAFLKWLTTDVYTGKRTSQVMIRMGGIAREAIEPALLRVMGDEFVEKLKERIRAVQAPDRRGEEEVPEHGLNTETGKDEPAPNQSEKCKESSRVFTTDDERRFVEVVKKICSEAGYDPDLVQLRDTINYCNASYRRPKKWFIRYFGDTRRKNITTLVPTLEARKLIADREVEDSPAVFGVSRIYINSVDDLLQMENLITRSLLILENEPAKPKEEIDSALSMD